MFFWYLWWRCWFDAWERRQLEHELTVLRAKVKR